MRRYRLLQRGGLLLGLALLAAQAPALAVDGFAFDVAAKDFDEHCLRIEAGEAIRWRFTATAPVDFNIHHHRGERVFYPVRRARAERASGSFRAPATDDYCLMWTNAGPASAAVRGSVERYR
jgi:hypothetical protein